MVPLTAVLLVARLDHMSAVQTADWMVGARGKCWAAMLAHQWAVAMALTKVDTKVDSLDASLVVH